MHIQYQIEYFNASSMPIMNANDEKKKIKPQNTHKHTPHTNQPTHIPTYTPTHLHKTIEQ